MVLCYNHTFFSKIFFVLQKHEKDKRLPLQEDAYVVEIKLVRQYLSAPLRSVASEQ